MWNEKQVERSLFNWKDWRKSIIRQWVYGPDLCKLSLSELESIIDPIFRGLGLRLKPSYIYWISCCCSDFNMDSPETWHNILIPYWYEELQKASSGNPILYRGGTRAYPPIVFDYRIREGYPLTVNVNHPLIDILHRTTGRPRRSSSKPGPVPRYSDRLAINCAVMKNKGASYVEIAREYELKTTKPYDSEQSDITRYLVKKGNRLLITINKESR